VRCHLSRGRVSCGPSGGGGACPGGGVAGARCCRGGAPRARVGLRSSIRRRRSARGPEPRQAHRRRLQSAGSAGPDAATMRRIRGGRARGRARRRAQRPLATHPTTAQRDASSSSWAKRGGGSKKRRAVVRPGRSPSACAARILMGWAARAAPVNEDHRLPLWVAILPVGKSTAVREGDLSNVPFRSGSGRLQVAAGRRDPAGALDLVHRRIHQGRHSAKGPGESAGSKDATSGSVPQRVCEQRTHHPRASHTERGPWCEPRTTCAFNKI